MIRDDSFLKQMAIIDANINRVSEGLRVVEDWARFYMRNPKLTQRLRELRHGLWNLVSKNYPQIVKGRDTGEDILAQTREGVRKAPEDIPRASINRVKEGIRVLEEMGKLISEQAAAEFKDMRFRMYDIEKEFYERSNKKDS